MTDISNVCLVYMDPPYGSKAEDRYYGVGETFKEYLEYIEERLFAIKVALHPEGSNLLVHIDQKASHYIKVMSDSIFGRENFQNEIVWCYTSPSVAKTHLPRKHDTLLWYGMGKYAFNQPYTPYADNFKIGGKTSWNPDVDKDTYVNKGKKLEDYWTDIPSLCRNEKEKLGYVTQKPEKLMKRIIESWSNEGDMVMDPYCGSGSFLSAAAQLKRDCIGLDINPDAIEITSKRLSK